MGHNDKSFPKPQIVIDTSVFIAALISQRGASYRLLMMADSDLFDANISVALIGEYEAVAKRIHHKTRLTLDEIEDILDYICIISNRSKIFFLWRPLLPDPGDDMIAELAVAAQCRYIVPFNRKDFVGVEQFGIQVLLPGEFLSLIGATS